MKILINRSNYKNSKVSILFIILLFLVFRTTHTNLMIKNSVKFNIWNIAMPIVTITSFVFLLKKYKFNYIEILLVILILAFNYNNIRIYYVVLNYFIASFIAKYEDINVSNLLGYLIFFSLVFQMILYRYQGRITLSILDPNYSGLIVLLAFHILKKKKFKKLSIIILLSGFLFLSRNYMLAVIVYYFSSLKLVKSIFKKIRLINYYKLIIVSIMVLVVISFGYVELYDYYDISQTNNNVNIHKYFRLLGRSNLRRFKANKEMIGYIFNYGDKSEYNINPHNFVFLNIFKFGFISTVLLLILYNNIFNKLLNYKNISIFMSILTYYMFLGPVGNNIWLIMTVIVLKYEKNKYDNLINIYH